MGLMTELGKGTRGLAAVALPTFGTAGPWGLGRGLRWLLHFMLTGAILAGLWYLNDALDLQKVLHSPWPALHKAWLPLLFAQFYLLAWLGYWLWWKLLGLGHRSADCAAIDDAWDEALRALHQAGIGLDDVPVFLVLGRPATGVSSLFQAAGIPLVVPQTPPRLNAPVHVFANREAIFVTCAEASLLGQQAKLFAEHSISAPPMPRPTLLAPMHAILARAQEQGRGPDQLTKREKQEISRLVALEKTAPAPEPSAPPLLTNQSVMDTMTARLQYLCRLLARKRRPYCPINGLILLIPLPTAAGAAGDGAAGDGAAGDGAAEAAQVATLTQRDVQAVHQVLQIDCPFFVLVCDLEKAPGFREFIERIPVDERLRPLGQRFPLLPDVDPHEIQTVMASGVDGLCRYVLPEAVCRRFRTEVVTEASASPPAPVRTNFRLYQLLAHLRKGCRQLGQILYRGTQIELGTPSMVAGCYLAATGTDPQRDQAFVAGIFQEFLHNQNFVAWSAQALTAEAAYHRRARLGYVGLLLLIVTLGVLGYVFVFPLAA